MKLYATIENEKGKREGVGSDNELIVELRHKNTRVRRFKFKLEDDTGGHNWEIEELDEGKTQQGERCWADGCNNPSGHSYKGEHYCDGHYTSIHEHK